MELVNSAKPICPWPKWPCYGGKTSLVMNSSINSRKRFFFYYGLAGTARQLFIHWMESAPRKLFSNDLHRILKGSSIFSFALWTNFSPECQAVAAFLLNLINVALSSLSQHRKGAWNELLTGYHNSVMFSRDAELGTLCTVSPGHQNKLVELMGRHLKKNSASLILCISPAGPQYIIVSAPQQNC